MKTEISFFLVFVIILSVTASLLLSNGNAEKTVNTAVSESRISVTAKSAVLMDADSMKIIYEKNCRQKLPVASTTKIMTAILVLEMLDTSQTITVSDSAVGVDGSSMYLLKGETLSVHDLLYGLMLPSGNDAATALAIAVSGSVSRFAEVMNRKAKQLSMNDTHFANPSGLPDENHYSTAYDMALLTSYAVKNHDFTEITSTVSIKVTNGSRFLYNRNKLLLSYDGMIGVKTGYTPEAGHCLVTCAVRNGATLICVTLNDDDTWNNHTKLLDYGFETIKK